MADDAYLLGIDNGTTVTKAALFDLEGREVAVGSQEVAVRHPEAGWAEQSMEEIWEVTVAAVRQCLGQAQIRPEAIQGVSLSGHGGGVWLIDRQGRPLHDASIWLDGRAKPYLDRWEAEEKLDALYDECGWRLFPGIGACTIFPWLMDHHPELLDRAAYNLWSKDWVKFRLTGELNTDQTMASIAHMNYERGTYSDRVLQLTGIEGFRDLFPPIVPSWAIAGRVTAQAAAETGLAEGTHVASGAWDGASSTLGAGAIAEGEAATVIGTAGIHAIVSGTPQKDPERVYSLMYHTVPDHWLKNSLTMLAAGNFNWFLETFCLAEKEAAAERGVSVYAMVDEEVAGVPVDAGGVLYQPFIQRERAPFVKPEARGVFFGLGDWHGRPHLLRAIFEGVALSTRDNYQAMQKDQPLETTYLTGGGSRSPVWCQILADCTGNIMRVPEGTELGARGAAINAGVAAGVFRDHAEAVARMVRIEREYRPDPQRVQRYAQLHALYRELIQASWELWERLWTLDVANWE